MAPAPINACRPPPTLVSVIVPVRDVANTLGDQLDALARQDYEGRWELVVVDSGSSDRTPEIVRRRLAAFSAARFVYTAGTAKNGASCARNHGAAHAIGDLLAFCDGDDVANPGWLSALARGARYGDIVAGALDVATLNHSALRDWHHPGSLRRTPIHEFLPYLSTANCAVWADVLRAIGGFDESHPGAEDKDFAWRAQLAGYRLHVSEEALMAYRYRSGLLAIVRQRYRWGRAEARLFRDFAAAGLRRSRFAEALHGWVWTVYSIPALPVSARWRGRWVVRTAQRCGRAAGSVRERVVFL